MVVKVFPHSAKSHASARQSRLLKNLQVVARQPHLQRATDSKSPVHLVLQSMFRLPHLLSSLIGGASERVEGHEAEGRQSDRHGFDGLVKASPYR